VIFNEGKITYKNPEKKSVDPLYLVDEMDDLLHSVRDEDDQSAGNDQSLRDENLEQQNQNI
jgi:hypothetical protein